MTSLWLKNSFLDSVKYMLNMTVSTAGLELIVIFISNLSSMKCQKIPQNFQKVKITSSNYFFCLTWPRILNLCLYKSSKAVAVTGKYLLLVNKWIINLQQQAVVTP